MSHTKDLEAANPREVVERMPEVLRTGAAIYPTVMVMMPNAVALHLARRIEESRTIRILEVEVERPFTRWELVWQAWFLTFGLYSFLELVAQYVRGFLQ